MGRTASRPKGSRHVVSSARSHWWSSGDPGSDRLGTRTETKNVKVAATGALIGAVMKDKRGRADAGRVRELILERLG